MQTDTARSASLSETGTNRNVILAISATPSRTVATQKHCVCACVLMC